MNTLPTWLEMLCDRIHREFFHFPADLGAALRPGVDLDATRTPILIRILEEVALPRVKVDRWGVCDAIQGAIDALRSGDRDALRTASVAATEATWEADDDKEGAAYLADAAWYASRAATNDGAWCAVAASYAANHDTASWRKIADIVLEETAQ